MDAGIYQLLGGPCFEPSIYTSNSCLRADWLDQRDFRRHMRPCPSPDPRGRTQKSSRRFKLLTVRLRFFFFDGPSWPSCTSLRLRIYRCWLSTMRPSVSLSTRPPVYATYSDWNSPTLNFRIYLSDAPAPSFEHAKIPPSTRMHIVDTRRLSPRCVHVAGSTSRGLKPNSSDASSLALNRRLSTQLLSYH